MASKIIVTGAVHGRFKEVFGKISKLQAKNAFSLAIILGDLFLEPTEVSSENGDNLTSLLNGEITIPLPTYFTLGRHPLPQQIVDKLESSDDEICPNLYFLGKRSTTKTSEGLRIVALGGSLDPEVTAGLSKDKHLPVHTESDAKALHGANAADILVTSNWPTSVRSRSNVKFPEGAEEPLAEQCIADLCLSLKPRYHFSTSDSIFYEREPFFHPSKDDQPDTSSITRFISLAAYDNSAKQKWLYAFTMDPNAAPPLTMPSGTTATPFNCTSRKRQPLVDQSQSYSRFNNDNGPQNHHRPNKRPRHKAPPPGPQECFFCLSNPNLATHLIASIAEDAYVTTAKGPLSTLSTYPTLNFPTHMLIIPLSHSPTLSMITPPETKISTYKEMQRYRSALHSLLISSSKGALGAVTWEVSRAEGIHIHWQFLPVPADLTKKGLVEAAFKVEAENEKYPTFKAKAIGDGTAEKGDYFRVWIWRPREGAESTLNGGGASDGDGMEKKGEEKELVLPLSAEFRFDLQFGRRVMAKLLGLEGRMHWKDCTQSDAEEKKDADGFKEAFKKFDFSLEEN
ncbi:MAG: hypothetical protein ASARMPREDX12_008617 [Alectoria sarmentosa]|nr:MAG: hypothetical protein ASARMPRED_007664 [Alectoria sarmentosa]CAD6578055.1 MAG: hypothetical protein ASARMPREDX12_008617 [Alectoria sarmentosa]